MRVSHAHEMAPRTNFKLNRGRPKKEAMCTRPFPRTCWRTRWSLHTKRASTRHLKTGVSCGNQPRAFKIKAAATNARRRLNARAAVYFFWMCAVGVPRAVSHGSARRLGPRWLGRWAAAAASWPGSWLRAESGRGRERERGTPVCLFTPAITIYAV